MGGLGFMLLTVFVVCMAVTVFGVGVALGAYLLSYLYRDRGAERMLKTHRSTVRQIDEVVDYYVGLQKYIAERLSESQK
jgi:hypothetical protein